MVPHRLAGLALAAIAVALAIPHLAGAALPVPVPGQVPQPELNRGPARAAEPIVLKGVDFPDWSARSNQTAKIPLTDVFDCPKVSGRDDCKHNHYTPPDVDTGGVGTGADVGKLAGFRWDAKAKRFEQIPFQVDEVFTRYLDNDASGFAAYSGQDQHTTYAYDREGWRFTANDPTDPCRAVPPDGVKTTPDPVAGLDDNDELSFMASDSGPQAPAGTPAPDGVTGLKEVTVRDPSDPTAAPTYAYVARGVKPAFDAANGYVQYKRDAPLADSFEKSQSSYSDYGNAAKGSYCDADGNVVQKDGKPDVQRRRPRDYASISTDRYKFRYDGRWLMTKLNISPDGGKTFGPDMVDRWKARAFAQDPSSETPCCGFEEEDTHWGGSSTLLGELRGPVRAIRETWGADSGTNVIRRETFYRESLVQKSWLRVHPIPPLDGIYAQWDFNGGAVTKFFNSKHPEGVAVDGRNDEAFGNLDDPCNDNYSANDTGQLDQGYRSFYAATPLCDLSPYHQSVDVFDPTFNQANAALEWSQVTGPGGTVVDRYNTAPEDLTPGGLAQSVVAVPYYRDDSCFDDGTGDDPGARVKPGSSDEPRKRADGSDRKCWHPEDGAPDASDRFFQGSIATHGVHLLFIADSDNARQTVPIDEIVSQQDMLMLPGQQPATVGAGVGQALQQPLTAKPRPATQVRDAAAPAVRLKVGRVKQRHAARVRWSGRDTGGSGLRSYRVQVRPPHGRWHTLRKAARHGGKVFYRAHRSGRFSFRVRATDRAGNRSRWAVKRARLRSQR
jgi:hypothetical protein